MKHFLSFLFLAGCLAGCASHSLPPFGTGTDWQLHGNTVVNDRYGLTVNFGGDSPMPLSNAFDGLYDLHFITTQAEFERYDPACARYMSDIVKSLPLSIDSINVALAEQFLIVTPSVVNHWKPDLIRRTDGTQFVAKTIPRDSNVQPHDELWRNLVFNDRKGQLIVVDRLIKDGHHYAIVYVLQSTNKHLPMAITYNYDVLDRHNTQHIGAALDHLIDISVAAWGRQPIGHPHSRKCAD